MSSEFICVAIDGTNSGTPVYKDSNVRKFFKSLNIDSKYKYFSDGPGEHSDPKKDGGILDTITGDSCVKIADEAWSWLTKALANSPKAKVILVGHSRGGHIVTNLAIRLSNRSRAPREQVGKNVLLTEGQNQANYLFSQTTVAVDALKLQTPFFNQNIQSFESTGTYFLGLYDAVKMTNDDLGDTSIVPTSVEYLCHIKRSAKLGSRRDWENTANKTARNDPEKYQMIELWGTHGSIGGSTTEGCEGGRNTTLFISAVVGGYAGYKLATVTVADCDYAISAETDRMSGKAAHNAMIVHARKAHIPI